MTIMIDLRHRARIACLSTGAAVDPALIEICRAAGYGVEKPIGPQTADIGVIDLREGAPTLRRASLLAEGLRRISPECTILFLSPPERIVSLGAPLRRLGEVVGVGEKVDHVGARLREILRLRNIAEESGERLKSLAAVNRSIGFPVISADPSPPRVLIVGAPGPIAMSAINALSSAVDICVCVLTAGQAMRALDHQRFDCALFLPFADDGATPALARALKRHPVHSRTAIVQIAETVDEQAVTARRGATDFLLADQIGEALLAKVVTATRRGRLFRSMSAFLRACSGEGVRDDASGIFTPSFLAQHASRLASRCDQADRPLSVTAVRLSHGGGDNQSRPCRENLRQAARLLTRVIRAEDFVARVAPGTIVIVSTSTILPDAERMALRLDGVLSNTAFRGNAKSAPQVLDVAVTAIAHEKGAPFVETLAAAIGRLEQSVRKPDAPRQSRR